MCDELTAADERESQANNPASKGNGLTRRKFSQLSAGASLVMALPPLANAQDVVEQDVLVEMSEGKADCYFVHPTTGRHAAVIIWPDIKGIRSAFRAMGKRLAQSGYSVLVVNPYYRTAEGQITPDGASFADPEIRALLMPHARSLSPETCLSDGRDFVRYLDNQTSVDTNRKIGTMGYCMTGSYSLRLAADMPQRIGAGASFHGGGLVTDEADSPHLLAPQIKAGLLIAIAENDHERQPEAQGTLIESFAAASVNAEVEVYEGSLHGWCPPDSGVYNEVAAEKAWSRLLALFEQELA